MSIPKTGSLAGTVTLMRHVVRRDRFRLLIWIAVAVFISTATYGAYEGLYPTMESRQGLQSQLGASPSLALLYGPAFDPRTPADSSPGESGSIRPWCWRSSRS